jgi:CBS domain-containing protein
MLLSSTTSTPAAVVVESAPLWVVADMVHAGQYEVVLVLNENQTVLGLLRADALLRLSPRLPQAPVRMLPLQRVIEVRDTLTLSEARELLTEPDLEGLLIEKPMLQGWTVLLRDAVLGEDLPQLSVA